MGTLLEVRNLTKTYTEGTTESKAVDHVSLDVEEGEFVMLMGASGSGKTSILHLVSGIDTCSEGTIRYRDRRGGEPTDEKYVDFGHMNEKEKTMFRRANIGIVFQQQCLIPDLTVYENMMLPLMLDRNRDRKEKDSMRDSMFKLCRQFGIEGHAGKYPSQLSGGQQQRAAILRSIANRPALLLCDEPTGSLNSAQTEIVMDLLEELNKNGQTIILVTHDIQVALRGKRVLYIEDGRIEGELDLTGPVQEDASNRPLPDTDFAGEGASHAVGGREEELIRFLQKRGW